MPNQRKKGVERITLTLPGALLRKVEAAGKKRKTDRLAVIRDAITAIVNVR